MPSPQPLLLLLFAVVQVVFRDRDSGADQHVH